MATLHDKADRTADESTSLAALERTASGLEPELRSALTAVDEEDAAARIAQTDTDDPEVRERISLRGRASFGRMLLGLISGRPVMDGAEAEHRAACGVLDEGLIPLDLFESDRPAPPETRAVTPAPATGTGVTVAPVQPFVFSESIAQRLGIDMPASAPAAISEMTISTALQPATRSPRAARPTAPRRR